MVVLSEDIMFNLLIEGKLSRYFECEVRGHIKHVCLDKENCNKYNDEGVNYTKVGEV